MLNQALALVHSRGWFDTEQPYEMAVNFTRGACLWLMLSRHGRNKAYLKLSDSVSLALEAQRCAEASRWYGDLVPRYIGHATQDGLDILVCEAVTYQDLNSVQMQRSSVQGHVLRDLHAFFAIQPTVELPHVLTPLPNAALVQAMQGYFSNTPLDGLATKWLESDVARQVASLPFHPQHGDLVINNLGRTPSGATIVFDWEDFGGCGLPGLDLFMLELSLTGSAARLADSRTDAGGAVASFVAQATQALSLELPDYFALTPIHALAFRYLKRNYGPGVRARTDQLLQELAATTVAA